MSSRLRGWFTHTHRSTGGSAGCFTLQKWSGTHASKKEDRKEEDREEGGQEDQEGREEA
jgi:hypothetical protein